MRLIDADALKAVLVPLWNCHDDSDFANKDVWRELENAPTIDAVPMIRCKDCVSWDTSWKPVRAIEGAYWCSEHDIYMSADDYCSMAERKEE